MDKFEIKGITIHNTNNEFSAKENVKMMNELIEQNIKVSVHYFVDAEEYIQASPLDQPTWHTGKGYDQGNMSTISIEICSKGSEDEYKKAEENALFLIRILMSKYDLRSNQIYFHRDFDTSFYCPHRILDKYSLEQFPKEKWIIDSGLKDYSDYLEKDEERKTRMLRRT